MGSNPIARSRISNLFHIKWPRNKVGYQSTTELAIEFPLILVLKPNIPGADPNREDIITPRVSLAMTLDGAIGSLGLADIKASYIAIYKSIKPIEVIHPISGIPPKSKRFYVHDAEKWGEVWSLRPVIVELQKIILPGEKLY